MITADLLRRVSLFAGLPDGERHTLASRSADVHLRQDEWLLLEGQAPAFFGLLEGSIGVFKTVHGHDRHITTYTPGDYFGEVPLLLGAPSLASLRALEPSRLARMDGDDFRELVGHCHVLNSEIMQTMVRRVERLQRVAIDSPLAFVHVVGRRLDLACYDLRDFLSRNRIPYHSIDIDDEASLALFTTEEFFAPDGPGAGIDRAGLETRRLPLLVLGDGRVFEAPTLREVADVLDLQTTPAHHEYDVVIVGGGPAGLAAAVYGASEGLRTLLVERRACGGQAGTSSRIENYLGFPAGLSGDELSARARQQALRFGAELLVARNAVTLEPGEAAQGVTCRHTVVLDGGDRIDASSVVLATGVHWRQLNLPELERFVGQGVYYGAAQTEALGLRGRNVFLIGGGNSAGQAAMMFANYADSVTMLVRGPSLAASMSQYLIDQLEAKDNIKVETGTRVTGVGGEQALEWIEIEQDGAAPQRRQADGLYVFIGATAETDWLPSAILRDQWGYLCTGRDVLDLLVEKGRPLWDTPRDPFLLETSVPGIFAAGDVRHGSVKRVASGVGEGSMSVALIHQYLAERARVKAARVTGA